MAGLGITLRLLVLTTILDLALCCVHSTTPAGGGCVFDEFELKALFGFNDVILKEKSIDECKQACLELTDLPCRSFDYVVKSQTCYFSSESRQTQSDDFGSHGESIYFEPHCDGTEPVFEYARECSFEKVANTALRSGREMVYEGSAESCQRMIRMSTNLWAEFKSFDYSRTTNRCYITTEDHETFPEFYGPSENFDYYSVKCASTIPTTTTVAPEGTSCTYVKQAESRIFLGTISEFWGGGIDICSYYCQSQHYPTCKSLEYERATGKCKLMSRSSESFEVYSWPGYDYYEKQCEGEDDYGTDEVTTEEDGDLDRENCKFDDTFHQYLPSESETRETQIGDCVWGCINNPENCKSVNYFFNSNTCQRNEENVGSSLTGLQENSSSLYVERKCADVIDATGCPSDWVPYGNKCYNLLKYWNTIDIRDNTKEACERAHGKPAFVQSKSELKFLEKYLKTDVEFEEMWSREPVNITSWWIGGVTKLALQGSLLTEKPNNVDTFAALIYTSENKFGIGATSKEEKFPIICEHERKKVTCPDFMFQCESYGCVSSSWVCDGQGDCNDESDEHSCEDKKRSLLTN